MCIGSGVVFVCIFEVFLLFCRVDDVMRWYIFGVVIYIGLDRILCCGGV